MKKAMKSTLRYVLFVVAFGMMVFLNTGDALAAEKYIAPSSTTTGASTMQYDTDYYTTKEANTEYFKFVTKGTVGYYRVYLTNISSGDIYAALVTASGRQIGDRINPYWDNGTSEILLGPEDLEPNTTYYLKVWSNTYGNYGLHLKHWADGEGVSKQTGKSISMNKDLTFRKEVNNDVDYLVFTATTTGNYRMTLTNIEGGDLYAAIHAYGSDRQIGNIINNWTKSTSRYADYALERGVKYYVKITGSHNNTAVKYGLLVSNQKVSKIKLNKTSLTFAETWQSYDLNETITPSTAADKSVTWSSSKPSVASVDSSGNVTSRGVGRAVITCKANDGSGKKATCTVVVKPGKMWSFYADSNKQSSKSVTLKWSKIDGASGYTIYQYKNKKWKAVKNTNKASYKISNLKSGTTYKFRIKAYVKNGSKKVYGKVSDTLTTSTLPGKASFSSIQQKGKLRSSGYWSSYRRVYFKANKVKGASGYQFSYCTSKNGSYSTFSLSGKRSGTTDFGFRVGTTFYYKVRAYRVVNGTYYYGAWSSPKKVKIRR